MTEQRTVTIALVFDVEEEPEYDGTTYTSYSLSKVRHVDTTVPRDAIFGIQESLAQSDQAYIGLPNAIISALEPGEYDASRNY